MQPPHPVIDKLQHIDSVFLGLVLLSFLAFIVKGSIFKDLRGTRSDLKQESQKKNLRSDIRRTNLATNQF